MLLDLSSYQQLPAFEHRSRWPFRSTPKELCLSLLPISLGKVRNFFRSVNFAQPYSDELLISRGWHRFVEGSPPIEVFEPAEMLRFYRIQINDPNIENLLVEDTGETSLENCLDEVIPAFVFFANPVATQEYLSILPPSYCNSLSGGPDKCWKPTAPSVLADPKIFLQFPTTSISPAQNLMGKTLSTTEPLVSETNPRSHTADLFGHSKSSQMDYASNSYLESSAMRDLWIKAPLYPEVMERCLAVTELAARIVENFFIQCNKITSSPFISFIEPNTRESLLQMSKRTVAEQTGCSLGRVDLCYLRILEAFDCLYGIPSQMSGLMGPRKKFVPCLNMSLLACEFLLQPLLSNSFHDPEMPCETLISNPPNRMKDVFIYPTLLPVRVAEVFPAWLAGKAHGLAICERKRIIQGGWRMLSREIIVAASRQSLEPHSSFPKIVAPHLNDQLLRVFAFLYTETANPRALHLLARIAEGYDVGRDHSLIVGLLEKAYISKFCPVADIISQLIPLTPIICESIMRVYLAAEDGVRAAHLLEKLEPSAICAASVQKFVDEAYSLLSRGSNETRSSKTSSAQFTKEERLRSSLAIIKSLAAANDVRGAIAYFHELRNSSSGILDISVANKIMHLCISNNYLTEAQKILTLLRKDAHSEINGMNFIPGACVHPDVVTCNIVIKGLARLKPPPIDEIDQLIHKMEDHFHWGGDGVRADQVTFNTAITAAVTANRFDKAWEYFSITRKRNIKIDGFACSSLIRQLGPDASPEIIEEVTKLADETEILHDPTLLSTFVEVYQHLGDAFNLQKLLDKYLSRTPKISSYSLATLIKGYGVCGRISKALVLWKKLEDRYTVQWTPYIMSCGLDCFIANDQLNHVLALLEKANTLNIPLTESQTSSVIKLCAQHQRYGDGVSIYKSAINGGIVLPNSTSEILVRGCVEIGDLETAMEILEVRSAILFLIRTFSGYWQWPRSFFVPSGADKSV